MQELFVIKRGKLCKFLLRSLRKSETDGQCAVNARHHGVVYMSDLLLEPALVDSPHLFEQYNGIPRQTAAGRHAYMRGQARLRYLARYSGGYDRGTVFVSHVVLYDKYRAKSSLFGTDHRRQLRVKNISSYYLHFIFSFRLSAFILAAGVRIYARQFEIFVNNKTGAKLLHIKQRLYDKR